ncbi:MAG: HAD family hydrolase [Nanoarchaeota archaeon]
MKIKSVVFDIDGCLLNSNYEFTVPVEQLRNLLERGKEKGMQFSINSNRSVEGMLEIYNTLGFNGVLIGEGGAFFYDPKTSATEFFGKKFDRDRLFSILSYLTLNLSFVNTDDVIKSPEKFVQGYGQSEITIFLEQSRQYTMTLYPREVADGTLKYNQTLLDSVASVVQPEFPEVQIDTSMKYGNLLMTPKGLEKGSLLPRLEAKIASFGDTEQDISMFVVSDYCGCPANASQGTKQTVAKLRGFVSDKSYTEGAYEFLEVMIDEN